MGSTGSAPPTTSNMPLAGHSMPGVLTVSSLPRLESTPAERHPGQDIVPQKSPTAPAMIPPPPIPAAVGRDRVWRSRESSWGADGTPERLDSAGVEQGDALPATQRPKKPGQVVVVYPNVYEGSGGGRGKGDRGGTVGAGEGEGEDVGGAQPVELLVEAPAERQEAEARECRDMVESLKIVPNKTWGKASKAQQQRWEMLECNSVVEGRTVRRAEPIDCTSRPSKPSDPLIAVCAGGTTRGVPLLEEQSLALFRFLLPSLGRTADCGFNYAAFIGYDVGDKFFDTDSGRAKMVSWFEREVEQPAASRGLRIDLHLVRVENKIQKPGPVFTAITKAAYDLGANYTYRVNDDSEMMNPWARKFVDALEAMGPPYGVVGPDSLNNHILVHDFTHRVHMDIFEGQYYPEVLTDWYVDDWISRVYGRRRTIRAKNCKVEHHTGAHGQRYKADTSKASKVDGLIEAGAKRIARWAKANGAEKAASDIATDRLDGKSATKEQARDIP